MAAYLIIKGPDDWAYQFPLKEDCIIRIGRAADCELRLSEPSVSFRHALLFLYRNRWTIQDNQSRNGTYVNGVMVQELSLADQDVIKIGKAEMIFQLADADDQPPDMREETLAFLAEQKKNSDKAHDNQTWDVEPESSQPVSEAAARQTPRPVVPVSPYTPLPISHPPTEPLVPEPPTAPGAIPTEDDEKTTLLNTGDDMGWVAGHVSDILLEIATHRDWCAQSLYKRILEHIRTIIGADNGFLSIADPEQNLWIIRAWVGDASGWTEYEKEHPLPLTIARQACKEDRVVSNALPRAGEEPPHSESLLLLNVHYYIAVPLHRENTIRGLLYFDTRRSLKTFAARDVRLLERLGDYILRVGERR
jgi:hypothetical protein